MRSILGIIILFAAGLANASLVDNGSFTTDTETGLDWLDLSETYALPITAALAANDGWRLATESEVAGLFGNLFVGYYDTDPYSHYSVSGDGNYANQDSDISHFYSLFGYADGYSNEHITLLSRSMGFFLDEGGAIRGMGVDIYDTNSIIYSPEYVAEYHAELYDTEYGWDGFGTYLVRTTTIPIPPAIWLFGSAIGGLGWFRRERK